MLSQKAVDATGSDLLSGWGGVVLGILAFLAVVAVCGFGILARLRDRAADRRSIEALRADREKGAAGNADSAPEETP
jgi:hypothetical protein